MNNVAFLLSGQYDLEIKCALFYSRFKTNAVSEDEVNEPEILDALERFKSVYRQKVQSIFDEADKQDKENLLIKLRSSNTPHEMGTVSEIAAKYKISKSEVRRRKEAGTLHELAA